MFRSVSSPEPVFFSGGPDGGRRRWRFLSARVLLLFLSILSLTGPVEAGEGVSGLRIALLTHDLGDPNAPGNVKLAVSLPDNLAGYAKRAAAGDFSVYVYPVGSPELAWDEGHLADGVYLWRHEDRVFLDARVIPGQEREGLSGVRVVFAPGGIPLAEGTAEGLLSSAATLADVILAVDVSSSMDYNDPRKRRIAAARAFVEMARLGGGIGGIGLVTFNFQAEAAAPLLPLSRGEEIAAALMRIGADGMTNLDAPLRLAMSELQAAGSRRPVIILLTDGRNEGAPYRNTHFECAKAGIRIFTIGLARGVDHGLLRTMAETTGGAYFPAPRDEDLPEIYARLAAELGKQRLLHAEILRTASGTLTLPVDGSVKRLVALADGGARLSLSGPGGQGGIFSFGGGAHAATPAVGDWRLDWNGASSGQSILALFGDTDFFLDMFPPLIGADRIAVGATLAHGERPLPDADVWVEPLPGNPIGRMQLFDDGLHGDGGAGDGVYAAVADFSGHSVAWPLEATIRARGTAWSHGAFARQVAAAAERLPQALIPDEPPPESFAEPLPEPPVPPIPADRASLDGDIDFGVLFPGEKGNARVKVELGADAPRDMSFDLAWKNAGDWDDLSAGVRVNPGANAFDVEIIVPETASPGEYSGDFTITDGRDLTDHSTARVRVGTVVLLGPESVDLGTIPPGTFVSREIPVDFSADKAAPLRVWIAGRPGEEGEQDLAATLDRDSVSAGRGVIRTTITASPPIDRKEGGYTGWATLRAGPGRAAIRVRWRVTAYAVRTETPPPLAGLPVPPSLGDHDDAAAIPDIGKADDEPASIHGGSGESPGGEPPGAGDSPWEKTEEALRDRPAVKNGDHFVGGVSEFPEIMPAAASGWDRIWDAWWIYLLALLLLLLLILLFLVFLLYRLGKSTLARFLLASALSSLILVAIFIAMLGSVLNIDPSADESLTINLVEDAGEAVVDLTAGERELLIASIAASSDNASPVQTDASPISSAIAAAVSAAAAVSSEAAVIDAKRTVVFEKAIEAAGMAEARSPSPLPLENRTEAKLERRERREKQIGNLNGPTERLPDLAEPPSAPGDVEARKAASASGAGRNQDATRPEIALSGPEDLPIWSDSARLARPLAGEQTSDVSGKRGVDNAPSVSAVGPNELRPRRRERVESGGEYPEPRQEIPDPVRDLAQSDSERDDADAARPDIGEIRPAPVFSDLAKDKGRAGTLPDFGVLDIPPALSDPADADMAGRAAERESRSGAERRRRDEAPMRRERVGDVPATPVPGNGDRPIGNADRHEAARSGRGLRESDAETEVRIDSLPAAPSAAGGMARNVPDQSAFESSGSSEHLAPSPTADGTAPPVEFSRPAGDVKGTAGNEGRMSDTRRGGQERRRDSDQNGTDAPGGLDLAQRGREQGDDPSGRDRGGENEDNRFGGDSSRGRNAGGRETGRDSGEGRFFDSGNGMGEGAFDGKGEGPLPDPGRSALPAGDGPDDALAVRPSDSQDSDWRR
ncbi:MAG: VWA domain-containing protein, partial [Planctomycetota bacterium]|nr:VWA domain-containing protein [Planctomycetota bacterium]